MWAFHRHMEAAMSGDPENLILTYLRRIDSKVDGLRTDMVEVKERLGFWEEQYASISRRVDRIGGDVERIKTRLDLVDAPVG
jgi:hypothetical protein